MQIDTKTIAASTDGYKVRIRLHAGTQVIVATHFGILPRLWRNHSILMFRSDCRSYSLFFLG